MRGIAFDGPTAIAACLLATAAQAADKPTYQPAPFWATSAPAIVP